jgi:hypothetical protein
MLNAGLGVATTAEIGSTGARLGAVTVIANEFNPTANIYGQSTLTIKPYTSGTAMIVGGVNNVSGSLDITQAELAYFVNGFSAITFGSSTTGSITMPNALTFSDPVTFDTNGSASIYIGADIAGIDNASITLSDPVRITARRSYFCNESIYSVREHFRWYKSKCREFNCQSWFKYSIICWGCRLIGEPGVSNADL